MPYTELIQAGNIREYVIFGNFRIERLVNDSIKAFIGNIEQKNTLDTLSNLINQNNLPIEITTTRQTGREIINFIKDNNL